ncbi:MAG: DNA alkylation repair protein [Prevotellaceae bacterium]|nr:DNA alkylation repair protein [Prevotellaceae bacterium]MDY3856342.1 DNA alkylation repair protein [Bacteroidaceae bacterium]
MTSQETHDKLMQVKQHLHSMMNGTVSRSLRDKGLNYKVIYGVEWPRLITLAQELGKDKALASALKKEDIRECRLLAGLLYPAEEFSDDLADVWVESMHYPEEAQYTTLSLFQYLPTARRLAYQWIADSRTMYQLCGYLLLTRLFMREGAIEGREANEFLDQAQSALTLPDISLHSAIRNALLKYAQTGPIEQKRAEQILSEDERRQMGIGKPSDGHQTQPDQTQKSPDESKKDNFSS